MDILMVQGNTYDLLLINKMMIVGESEYREKYVEIYKQFQRDIYTTYKQIRHICNPRACEKTSLQTVKASLKEHWLEQYLNLTLQEANLVIDYADKFFGLAIK